MGPDDRRGGDRHRHEPGPGAQGQDRQGPHRRHRVPVQEEQDRLDQGIGPARRQRRPARDGRDHRGRQAVACGQEGDHRRHRLAAAQRPRHRDRSQAHHHERRSDQPEDDPQVDRHPGQRRRRRRVRLDLPPLRQRGDHHRAAAADRAGRGRSGLDRARALVQEAGHQGPDRHQGDEREGRRERRRHRGPAGRRQVGQDRARSTCSSPPAADP